MFVRRTLNFPVHWKQEMEKKSHLMKPHDFAKRKKKKQAKTNNNKK